MGSFKQDVLKAWDQLVFYKDLAKYSNDPELKRIVANKNKR